MSLGFGTQVQMSNIQPTHFTSAILHLHCIIYSLTNLYDTYTNQKSSLTLWHWMQQTGNMRSDVQNTERCLLPPMADYGRSYTALIYNCTIIIPRGSVRSTRGLGPTMTARGQIIGISIGMLPRTLIMSITVQKTSKYYTTEFDLEEGFLNGACISISNLPENIAWQTHRPEARGPLKSGAWGGHPTCHPQTPPLIIPLCHSSTCSTHYTIKA